MIYSSELNTKIILNVTCSVLLIDEYGDSEVTDMQRTVKGEVISISLMSQHN